MLELFKVSVSFGVIMDENLKAILHHVENKFIETANEAIDVIQEQITQENREYPRATIRKQGRGVTGKLATSPRDVVDTGELRDSLQVASDNKTVVEAKWTAPHAIYVARGTDKQPPYNWINEGLLKYDIISELERKINS